MGNLCRYRGLWTKQTKQLPPLSRIYSRSTFSLTFSSRVVDFGLIVITQDGARMRSAFFVLFHCCLILKSVLEVMPPGGKPDGSLERHERQTILRPGRKGSCSRRPRGTTKQDGMTRLFNVFTSHLAVWVLGAL